MSDALIHWGTEIHCKVIGNKDHGARQHWDKINSWVDGELKYKIDYTFIFITFITTMLLLNFSTYFLSTSSENLYRFSIIGLLSAIITYFLNSVVKHDRQ